MISIELDSCFASLSKNTKKSLKRLQNVFIGYTVCVNFQKEGFSNLDVGRFCDLFWIEK